MCCSGFVIQGVTEHTGTLTTAGQKDATVATCLACGKIFSEDDFITNLRLESRDERI